MSKYAPANGNGDKPYVVEMIDWGRDRSTVVYARDAQQAKWKAMGRGHVGLYHTKTRRATPDEVDTAGAA